MAFFGKKKTEIVEKPKQAAESSAMPADLYILRPRITEKASMMTEKNVYVFETKQGVSKGQIAKAVKELYGVTPVKVRTAKTPAKKVFVRGKRGVKGGVSKAYVYLKKGDKIENV